MPADAHPSQPVEGKSCHAVGVRDRYNSPWDYRVRGAPARTAPDARNTGRLPALFATGGTTLSPAGVRPGPNHFGATPEVGMTRSLLFASPVAVWLVFSANPAHAQTPRSPYLPPDAKGYRIQQITQAWAQQTARAEAAAHPPVSATWAAHTAHPVQVEISMVIPNAAENPPAVVALRGPDGEVRTFRVEGGRDALHSRVIVVHPGESITIRVPTVRAP